MTIIKICVPFCAEGIIAIIKILPRNSGLPVWQAQDATAQCSRLNLAPASVRLI